MRIVLSLLFLSIWFTALTQTEPCDWFDHNGDGFLGANTWVYALGQYGTAGEMDADSTGFVDVRDLLAFMPYFGYTCPQEWRDTTANHILDIALVEYQVHTEEVLGFESYNLPAGSTTYRLYAQLAEPTDRVLAVYGDDQAPLSLETEGAFYGFGNQTLNTITVSDYQPFWEMIAPATSYNTWFSIDVMPEDIQGYTFTALKQEGDWDEMASNGQIYLSDSTGGAWFLTDYLDFDTDGMFLLGQFTVMGTADFQGIVNLLAHTNNGEGVELAEGLTFSSDNLAVFGCMDPEAGNYNPNATHEPIGACLNPGDFNGDGEYTSSDLLELIGLFGCLDCGMGDLNGDGVFTVQDLLVFLSL